MKISIIIPCYNEASTIELIIEKILEIKDLNYEIIIIDDCSTDGTKEILKNKLSEKVKKQVFNEKNFGKGYAIREGLKYTSGDIVIIQDADLEYTPKDYKRLIKPIIDGNADVVYGSRFIGSSEKRVLYFWHTVGNKILTILSNIFTNLNLTDMEVCYKVLKVKLLKILN